MFRLSRDGCTSLSVASILTRSITILYIKTSLSLCFLSSNVGHFSSSSMLVTDEVLWYLFTTYLAAQRWTISIRFLFSLRCGSQVVHAYSNVGLTNDFSAFSFMFAFLIFRFRFKKLMVLFAFLQMFDMCWFHFISDVIETLRYFAVVTCSSW